MELTYKQIIDALVEVFNKDFDRKKGRQWRAKYDRLDDVPMREMTYLLDGVGNNDSVNIKE